MTVSQKLINYKLQICLRQQELPRTDTSRSKRTKYFISEYKLGIIGDFSPKLGLINDLNLNQKSDPLTFWLTFFYTDKKKWREF